MDRSKEEIEFIGVVTAPSRLTGAGPGQFAIVTLNFPTEGFNFASINMNTKGRAEVLSQIGGQFTQGVPVKGRGTRGPEALTATHIELAL